ncbi:MAG: UDP-glucose 4-epimerase GalE [Actinomycetes bacterium]
MKVLVTGGAGYIGGTAVSMLLDAGYSVNVLDNCSTGHADSVDPRATFFNESLLNAGAVQSALSGVDAVLHFSAKSLVGESVTKPDIYWETNVSGTRILLDSMQSAGIKKLVFSSTAATYGEPKEIPITEESVTNPTNPYGASKLAVDYMITAQANAYGLAAISLRYFNVAGALKTSRGWQSERHNPETHLIPNVLRASTENPLKVFGEDWPTADGTCIRDYVHVVDLIKAHISALSVATPSSHEIINLGSGGGYSVKEVIASAEKTLGRAVPCLSAPRRAGDPAVLIADISKAGRLLSWKPELDLDAMVSDAWKSFNE